MCRSWDDGAYGRNGYINVEFKGLWFPGLATHIGKLEEIERGHFRVHVFNE